MRIALIFLSLFFAFPTYAQDLEYYLPDSVMYNPAIPKPKEVIYHEVGEWHVTHDRLVAYMHTLAAAAPDRIKLEVMGFTYEQRPQVLLIITSPANHRKLEQIRQQHVQLTDPAVSGTLPIAEMPAVVWIGHSIHGNEASGSNASLVSAYYLAAAQGKSINDLLENTVILFDPSFNPDGLQRFSTWVNQHRGKNLVTDPSSREFNEVWPGGRFNHYWFDLNRDWLPAVHVESHNRLRWFHRWKPNVLTDHHEQGSNATFFFQPGVPSRVNPLTPDKNVELTAKLGRYHAAYLDRIGSLYFTRENYDDFYYGKGSTYPDINGGVGILFEQASSRGHSLQTANGVLRFPFTIRNQFITTLSTLEGVRNLREELLSFQRDFFRSSLSEGTAAPVKAYVIGENGDRSKTEIFTTMLSRHGIQFYPLARNVEAGGMSFSKEHAYIIPTAQTQYRLIRTIFEKTRTYADSLFYDITAWTMPLAFNLPVAELTSRDFRADLMDKNARKYDTSANAAKSSYAYIVEWTETLAPALLYELQNGKVVTRVSTMPMEVEMEGRNKKFGYGTIMIPVQLQEMDGDRLYETLQRISKKYGVPFYALSGGSVISGSDLGSSRFVPLVKPVVGLLVGTGVNPTDAGEYWHLLDQRFNIPLSLLEISMVNRADLSKYNVLVLAGGNYTDLNKEKIKGWVQGGGVLIVMEEAVTWAATAGISNVTFKKILSADSTLTFPYVVRDEISGAQNMRGSIFRADVDLTHPLAYGYARPYMYLFKANKVFPEKSRLPYATPFFYKSEPLESGWLSRQNYDAVKNSAAVVVHALGSGRVISIADNPNFRAHWLGGTKLMMNALFFGRMIDSGSAPAE